MKKLLLLLFSVLIIINTSNAQLFSIKKCYTSPTLSYGNTVATTAGSVNFVSGVDIPAGQTVVDVVVEIVWSKTDDGSCGAITGIASDLSHIGFWLKGPLGGNRLLSPSAAVAPFFGLSDAGFIGIFPASSQGVVRDTIVFKDGYSSLSPAGLPNFPFRDTVAPSQSLGYYNNTSPYGTWSIAATDDPPLAGPKLCIHSYCITIRTCNYNTNAPLPNLATLPDINTMCTVESLIPPTATDECDYTVSHNLTLPFNTPGTTVITWTFKDVWGNTATQNQNINYTAIANQGVTASPVSICSGSLSTITVGSTQTGVNYSLRDNTNNAIIAGPIAGTGSSINFSTGVLTSTTTYNVYASNSTCNLQMTNTPIVTVSAISTTALITHVACFGETTGAINITPSGGTGTYTYNWGGGVTTDPS